MSDVLVTAAEAAEHVGVERQTIYVWSSRGILTPVTKVGRRSLFLLSDVFTAEATRDHTRRRRES